MTIVTAATISRMPAAPCTVKGSPKTATPMTTAVSGSKAPKTEVSVGPMRLMACTNRTYGRNRVVVAAQGFAPLKMNRQHLSQEYTTDWKQIITVKAD